MYNKFLKLCTFLGLLVLILAYQNCGKFSKNASHSLSSSESSNDSSTDNSGDPSGDSTDNSQNSESTLDDSQPVESVLVKVCPDYPSSGFVTCFYDDLTLTRLVSMSSSSVVAGNYDGVTAPSTGVPPIGFSALWKGALVTQAGEYELSVTADDGVVVSVDGVVIIDQWQDRYPATFKAKKTFASGTHKVEIKYYNAKGGGTLSFDAKVAAASPPVAPAPPSTQPPNPPPVAQPSPTPVPPVQQAFVGNQIIYYGPAEFAAQAAAFNYEHLRLTGGQGQVGPFWLHKGADSGLQVISVNGTSRLKMEIKDGVKWQGYNYDRTELCVRTNQPDGFLNPDTTYVIDWKGSLDGVVPYVTGHMSVLWNAHGQDRISGPNWMAFAGDDLVFYDLRDPRGKQTYFIAKHRDLVNNPMHFRIFWKPHDTNGYLRVEINGKVLMERKGGQTKNAGGWNYFKFGGLYDYDRRIVSPTNSSKNHYATITEFFRFGKL